MAMPEVRSAPSAARTGYVPIGDYAAIGDGRTAALVARDGSIDWLPLPRLDGETAFGALLDAERGGSFRLGPEDEFTATRRYLPSTNVLETTFRTATGCVRVLDALTLRDGGLMPWVELVRSVECIEGSVRLRWSIAPRFGYGVATTTVGERDGMPIAAGAGQRLAVLAWDVGAPKITPGVTRFLSIKPLPIVSATA